MKITILLVLLLVALCHCYTLKSNQKLKHLPVQLNLLQSQKSFQRFQRNKLEILHCPQGFTFDQKKMICHLDPKIADLQYAHQKCPSNYNGLIPDPFNCRNFINCHDGIAYLQTCSAHLLFSEVAKNCEWPEASQCCEYGENMLSDKHVSLAKFY